jgi:hypothetical protein
MSETISGFVVRCFSDDFARKDFSGIICDICESIKEVADAIVEHLEEYVVNDEDDSELSTETLKRVRERIIEEAEPPVWEFDPRDFEELADTNAPVSLKINQVCLSPRLIERIRNT